MALYNKYRPQVFSEVISHEAIKKTLLKALATKTLAQAILLIGPRGVGKTTIARLIAKSLNCQKPQEGEPCLKCASCQAIALGNHLDVIEIDAASNRGIDEIRSLKEKLLMLPSLGKKRVYIIDEVHMLTKEAFNALLKTLEEPPVHVVFIMATTEAHKVPQTILSRSQRFHLKPPSFLEIKTALLKVAKAEDIDIIEEALEELAEISEGSFRDALAFLEQVRTFAPGEKITGNLLNKILALPDRKILLELFYALLKESKKEYLQRLEKLFSGEYNTEMVAKLWLKIFKELILIDFLDPKELPEDLRFKNELLSLKNSFNYKKLLSLGEELIRVIQSAKMQSEASLPYILFGLKVYEELKKTDSKLEVPAKDPQNSSTLEGGSNLKVSSSKKEKEEKSESKPSQNPSLEVRENFTKISDARWRDFLLNLAKENPALFALIKDAEIEVEEEKIKIFHQFSFHRRRLRESSTRLLLLSFLDKYFNRKFVLEISETPFSKEKTGEEEEVDDSTFESTVVEVFELEGGI